jgi:type I restriction enzyme, S subunit
LPASNSCTGSGRVSSGSASFASRTRPRPKSGTQYSPPDPRYVPEHLLAPISDVCTAALFTTTASVDRLKQTVLQLAAMGKLVPQDPNDESASTLLKRIAAEKAKQVSEGRLNESRYSRGVDSTKHAFELPRNWKLTTLAELATTITDGAHQTPSYVNDGIAFLSVKDMSDGYLNFTNTRFISEDEHSRLFQRCNPEYGDLLITKVGTTGIPVIVDVEQEFSLFVSVALVKAPWNLVSVNYLYYLISSPFMKAQSSAGTQGIGNKNLVLKTIANIAIPLAPLAEQRRIVSKLEELIKLCDALKHQLAKAQQGQIEFADGGRRRHAVARARVLCSCVRVPARISSLVTLGVFYWGSMANSKSGQ